MTIVIALLTALVVTNAVTLVVIIIQLAQAQQQPGQHTQSTEHGLMDVMATQYDVIQYFELRTLRLQAALDETKAAEARAKKAVETLGVIRQGPYAYNPDQPAGRRKERKD